MNAALELIRAVESNGDSSESTIPAPAQKGRQPNCQICSTKKRMSARAAFLEPSAIAHEVKLRAENLQKIEIF
jgi:hypothetical protein